MSKAKKKTIILISVLIAVSVVIFLLAWSLGAFSQKPMDDYDKCINTINYQDQSDFMLYGDDLQFRENFKYRKLQTLENDEIFKNEDVQFRFLVIIDEENRLSISEQEIDRIVELIHEDNLVVISFHSVLSKKLMSYSLFENSYETDLSVNCVLAVRSKSENQIISANHSYYSSFGIYDNAFCILRICSRFIITGSILLIGFY